MNPNQPDLNSPKFAQPQQPMQGGAAVPELDGQPQHPADPIISPDTSHGSQMSDFSQPMHSNDPSISQGSSSNGAPGHLHAQPPHLNDPSVPHAANQHRVSNQEIPTDAHHAINTGAPAAHTDGTGAQPIGGHQPSVAGYHGAAASETPVTPQNSVNQNPGIVKYHGAMATQDPNAVQVPATHESQPAVAKYHGAVATEDPEDKHVSSTAAGERLGHKLKGYAAQGHGLGEFLRGNVNAAVDTAAGNKSGMAKHEAIAKQGEEEIKHGEIANKGRHNMKY